jgi:hypothetical protein
VMGWGVLSASETHQNRRMGQKKIAPTLNSSSRMNAPPCIRGQASANAVEAPTRLWVALVFLGHMN